MTALLPCPFCGGPARIVMRMGAYSVQCSECEGRIGGWHLCKENAAAEWNQRVEQ